MKYMGRNLAGLQRRKFKTMQETGTRSASTNSATKWQELGEIGS